MATEMQFSYAFADGNPSGITQTYTDVIVDYSNPINAGSYQYFNVSGTISAVINGTQQQLSNLRVFINDPNQSSSQYALYGGYFVGSTVYELNFDYNGQTPSSLVREFADNHQNAQQPTNFTNASDPVAVNSTIVTCFATGTLIRTTRGDVAVEDLAVADLAVVSSGEHRPIRWIGHTEVDCRNHPRPGEAMPVRVQAGAFGSNRPERDLWLSPGHSVCLDVLGEVLTPISSLINGATVAQVDVPRITYWHIEFDSHDVLIANGMPAESYMDCGNRAFFATGEGAVDPDRATATPADYCRPFHHEGALVAAMRGQLRARAKTLGWQISEKVDDDLHLVADGVVIGSARAGDAARFVVPASAKDVWLMSRSFVPHHVSDSVDGRQLGVMVHGITIDDGLGTRRHTAHDDPLLCVGFHHPEAGFRWTAGRARLPAALWDGCCDVFFLSLKVTSDCLRAWEAPEGLVLSEAPITGEAQRGLRLVHAA